MFIQILKKTSIDKHLNVFLHMMSRLLVLHCPFSIAAVASASTLVAVNILKSEENEPFKQKLTSLKEIITTH